MRGLMLFGLYALAVLPTCVVCKEPSRGPEIHFQIVSCEAVYKKTGKGRKTGYVLHALVTQDVEGRLLLLENATDKASRWKKLHVLDGCRQVLHKELGRVQAPQQQRPAQRPLLLSEAGLRPGR